MDKLDQSQSLRAARLHCDQPSRPLDSPGDSTGVPPRLRQPRTERDASIQVTSVTTPRLATAKDILLRPAHLLLLVLPLPPPPMAPPVSAATDDCATVMTGLPDGQLSYFSPVASVTPFRSVPRFSSVRP